MGYNVNQVCRLELTLNQPPPSNINNLAHRQLVNNLVVQRMGAFSWFMQQMPTALTMGCKAVGINDDECHFLAQFLPFFCWVPQPDLTTCALSLLIMPSKISSIPCIGFLSEKNLIKTLSVGELCHGISVPSGNFT